MKILITGVSGYIGSILYHHLISNYKTIGLDKKKDKYIRNINCNLKIKNSINILLKKIKPDLIIHLAGQSLVDETINKKKYLDNNVIATKNLINAMTKNGINKIIFSSTASVYKSSNKNLTETSELKTENIYAKTKLECEKIIKNSKINYIILRFFNVCSSFTIKNKIFGEYHNPETHLIPTIVYKNILKKKFFIYGNNYNTKDGTCIRDYIHVKDVCIAIEKSIKKIFKTSKISEIINIGSSSSKTNLDILKKVEKITKINSIYKIINNRKGDVDKLTCSINKAKKILNWRPKYSSIKNIVNGEIRWVKFLIKNDKKRVFKNYF